MATGATRTNIIKSVRRIIEQEVISVSRQGIGTRPTEYGLNFDFAKNKKPFAKNKKPIGPSASGSVDDTSKIVRGTVDDTSNESPPAVLLTIPLLAVLYTIPHAVLLDDTSSGASGIVHGTKSYLRKVLTSTLTVSRNEDAPAVATPPPVSDQEAHTAGTAVDPEKVGTPSGFEELWTVWPRKHHIAKARAAYRALAPDAALRATVVAKATQWAAHYQQTATEKKWWKHLHNWLGQECYLEDREEPYENPKEAAIARKRENGPRKGKASKQDAVGKSGLSSGTPIGRHKVSVTNFDIVGGAFDQEQEFIVSFKIEDGDHVGKALAHARSASCRVTKIGTRCPVRRSISSIRHATGICDPEDTSEFHGKTLFASVKPMGRIEYATL